LSLCPVSLNEQFMQPMIVNRFSTPSLQDDPYTASDICVPGNLKDVLPDFWKMCLNSFYATKFLLHISLTAGTLFFLYTLHANT